MSEKKSLLLGALLGGIAAGATMYVLKTENGQAMKKLAQEKMSNLKIRAQEYMEEQGYSQEDIQNKISHFIPQTNKQIFPQKKDASVSVHSESDTKMQQEFLSLQKELTHLENHLPKP